MKGFMADIMGVIGCSLLASPEAAVSESDESELELEAPFEELALLDWPLPLELELEPPPPPPTRFWMKSCRRPHSTGRTGAKQPTRQSEQASAYASCSSFTCRPFLVRLVALTSLAGQLAFGDLMLFS